MSVQAATNLYSFQSMSVNLAQFRGTVGSFNNLNIAGKIIYSLLTCKFFQKLTRNIIFLVITLLYSITLILPLSFSFKQFPYKNKNYLLVGSDNFFDVYRHNVDSIYMGTCFSNYPEW